MAFTITAEEWKRYFWYFFGTLGVVFFWAGVWDGFIGPGPYLSRPWVSALVGAAMLAFSGLLRKEAADPLRAAEKQLHATLHKVRNHPQKHEFHIQYEDHLRRKKVLLKADRLQRIEKGFLVLYGKGKEEMFVPIHRVINVFHKGKEFK